MQQMKQMALSIKNEGLRASFRKYGWKLFAVVFAYYLVRDVSLYVLIPYFLLNNF